MTDFAVRSWSKGLFKKKNKKNNIQGKSCIVELHTHLFGWLCYLFYFETGYHQTVHASTEFSLLTSASQAAGIRGWGHQA